MQPLLSIVIANYNYGRFLEEAIKSVIAQDMGDKVELIICDASSKDNSVEIIKKYANGLPPNTAYADWVASHPSSPTAHPLITWWCSEPDGGQSAAFNKGFSHAKGKYLTWLNADDLLLPNTIKRFSALAEKCHPDWVTGNMIRFDDETNEIIEANWGPHWIPDILQTKCMPIMVFGPTSFWRRSLLDTIGYIDVNCHFMMDSEYWMRLLKNGVRQKRLNHDCWAFRMHTESKTAEFSDHRLSCEQLHKFKEEAEYCIHKNGYQESCCITNILRIMRLIDGSAIVRLWREIFWCGRKINKVFTEVEI